MRPDRPTWEVKAMRDSIYPISVRPARICHDVSCGLYLPPGTADYILNSNLGLPLRGIAIGNGWIDARRQYPSYLDFAVKVGVLEENSDVRSG